MDTLVRASPTKTVTFLLPAEVVAIPIEVSVSTTFTKGKKNILTNTNFYWFLTDFPSKLATSVPLINHHLHTVDQTTTETLLMEDLRKRKENLEAERTIAGKMVTQFSSPTSPFAANLNCLCNRNRIRKKR